MTLQQTSRPKPPEVRKPPGRSSRVSRRRLLRRAVGGTLGLVGLEWGVSSIVFLYPNIQGGFGAAVDVGKPEEYPAALPEDAKLDSKGIFYIQKAKTYLVHLSKDTKILNEAALKPEGFVKAEDGSYWIALYQKCVHLGCKVPFNDGCEHFQCPCHGSQYNVDGEYQAGPAPRSLDRFKLSVKPDSITVNTGVLISPVVPRPEEDKRVIARAPKTCH